MGDIEVNNEVELSANESNDDELNSKDLEDDSEEEEEKEGKRKGKWKGKRDRRFLRPWDHTETLGIISYPIVQQNQWRLVKNTEFEEIHIAEIGEGRHVVAQVIYA